MIDYSPSFAEMPIWFRLLSGLLVGLALGSFFTMLQYRLPRRLSIVGPRSFCPSCKTPLNVFDLVPVFSWLYARGRCRHCGVAIGKKYIWIELVTTLVAMIVFALL
jgi:leader peptidase (prepilin peptidase)/N-methyltransferase